MKKKGLDFFRCESCGKIHYHQDIAMMPPKLYHPYHRGNCPHCRKYTTHRALKNHSQAVIARLMGEIYTIQSDGQIKGTEFYHVFDLGPSGGNKNLSREKQISIDQWREKYLWGGDYYYRKEQRIATFFKK